VPAPHEQFQQELRRRFAGGADVGQALRLSATEPGGGDAGRSHVRHGEPGREGRERLARGDGDARPAFRVDARRAALGHFVAHPGRQRLRKERHRGVAILPRLHLPVERRRRHRLRGLREKRRNRRQARLGALEPLRQRREVARDEAQHAEDGLARPERRIAVHEVAALVFGERDLERRVREREIDVARERTHVCVGHTSGRLELTAERPQFIGLRAKGRRRPVGQHAVVLVQSGERGGHRPLPVERLEEAVERGAGRIGRPYASGSVTHRRSRNERSTALIVSCTQAPSSKLPSLNASSARISPMKLLTRFA
jgi:hypothetical protein